MAPQPVAIYGLEVPVGVLIPANPDFPASFRITMAAIDPIEEPQAVDGEVPAVPRSTLRIVRQSIDSIDDGDDEIDEDYMQALLEASQEDEEDSDEEEAGPSDPKKKKKAADQLIEALKKAEAEDSDEDMEDAKASKKGKGKGKASDEDEEDDDSEISDDDDEDLEQFMVCTLDTERNYQQPLDIHVNENEKVFFLVTGTHNVHLTGNYVIDDEEEDDEDDEDDEEDMYDLAGDELLGEDLSDDEEDELDDIENPRVMEVDSEEEEAPKLVAAKKGKNKRAADEAEGLDELITKDDKASKKQAKKVKNNKGEAVPSEDSKGDKKVQFAKNLEQGPTGSAAKAKQSGKGALGVRVVQGVTVDDRKIGEGRTVKTGDTVGVRYIGKLENGKVFDANKKGKPFSFKAGKGQVIKGWDIGLQGMAIGGERRLTVPANLAYGSKGLPGIPANSTLQFDIKLLEIK